MNSSAWVACKKKNPCAVCGKIGLGCKEKSGVVMCWGLRHGKLSRVRLKGAWVLKLKEHDEKAKRREAREDCGPTLL